MAKHQILFFRSKKNLTPRWLFADIGRGGIYRLCDKRADADVFTDSGLASANVIIEKKWNPQERADWMRVIPLETTDAEVEAIITEWQSKPTAPKDGAPE